MRIASNVQESECCKNSTIQTRGQNYGFRGNFGVEQSPRNTVLSSLRREDVPCTSETKRSELFKSLVSLSNVSRTTVVKRSVSKMRLEAWK